MSVTTAERRSSESTETQVVHSRVIDENLAGLFDLPYFLISRYCAIFYTLRQGKISNGFPLNERHSEMLLKLKAAMRVLFLLENLRPKDRMVGSACSREYDKKQKTSRDRCESIKSR